MDKIIEILISEYGLVGILIAAAIFILRNKKVQDSLQKSYFKLINPVSKLSNHSLFKRKYSRHSDIANLHIDNKVNELFLKLLLHIKNKTIYQEAEKFIKISNNINKVDLNNYMIKNINNIIEIYSIKYKEKILEKYLSIDKFTTLVRLNLDCQFINSGICKNCKDCYFVEELTEEQRKERLLAIADKILEHFSERNKPNVIVIKNSISDINAAFKTKKERLDDYFNELNRAMTAAIRDVVIALKNMNGFIYNMLSDNREVPEEKKPDKS